METGELTAWRTGRKLWLASFHQDATIARSNAAILLRSAPPTHQSLLDMRLILVPEMKVIHLEILVIFMHNAEQYLRETH